MKNILSLIIDSNNISGMFWRQFMAIQAKNWTINKRVKYLVRYSRKFETKKILKNCESLVIK